MYYEIDRRKERRKYKSQHDSYLYAYHWTRLYQRVRGCLPTIRRHSKSYQAAWRIVAQRKMVR